MTPQFEAAKRIAGMMPKDIRALDDESTLKLIADLAMIGTGVAAWLVDDLPLARAKMAKVNYWAGCLTAANRVLRGEEARAADPRRGDVVARAAPHTRAQRLQGVAQRGSCGITADEVNAWLATLPDRPLHGEA